MKAILLGVLMSVGVTTGGPAYAGVSVAQTSQESGPPVASSPLPEIGRTRSRTVCSALRDVVAPAIVSAKNADNEFSAARTAIFDSVAGDIAGRAMTNRKIERALRAMAQDVVALEALQGDRRLLAETGASPSGADKAAADLLVAVRLLYESEARQLNALNAFIETGRRTELKDDDEDALLMKASLKDIVAPPRGSNIAGHETYLGAPPRYTNKLAEANEIDRWMGRVTAVTNRREETAGKVISAVAAFCR